MTRRLVNQFETDTPDSGGRYYGFERFYDDAEGFWTVRFHCRIYDGIRVAHSWATDEVRINADTPEGARAEMYAAYETFRNAYRIGDDL